jgi:hypothetical protein
MMRSELLQRGESHVNCSQGASDGSEAIYGSAKRRARIPHAGCTRRFKGLPAGWKPPKVIDLDSEPFKLRANS